MKIILYCSYIAQAIFFLVSSTAYVLIILHQVHRSRLFEDSATRNNARRISRRTCLISFLINLMFLVTYVLPNYIEIPDNYQKQMILSGISYFGLLVDPVIYTLLHKDLRPITLRCFTCINHLRHNDEEKTEEEFS